VIGGIPTWHLLHNSCIMSVNNFLLLLAIAIVCLLLYKRIKQKVALKSLKGKRVVVCGASKGIGREIALEYARHNARLILASRTKEELDQVAADATAAGAMQVAVYPVDLGSEEGCRNLIVYARSQLGGIDTLVLVHWRAYFCYFGAATMDDITKVFSVGLVSFVLLAHQALQDLLASKGNLVVVSSFAGKFGMPYAVPYCATKHGLHGFCDALRIDLALQHGTDHGVGITACVLGDVDTKTSREMINPYMKQGKRMPADETAAAIVRAGTMRKRELYYPWFPLYPATVLHVLLPALAEWIVLMLSKKQKKE